MTARVMGIVNITDDSFSDGGRYRDAAVALDYARRLLREGADLVDLGPASSHPDAADVSADEEIARLAPVLAGLEDVRSRVSVDSFRPETQLFAARRGVGILNDIAGFPDPEVQRGLARHSCRLVVMHSVHERGRAQRGRSITIEEVWRSMLSFFRTRIDELTAAGVEPERLILDPGMGLFLGDDPQSSWRVLRGVRFLREVFALPVLVGVSRKGFLKSAVVGEGGPATTLAAELYAAREGTQYIRTHDPAALASALAVERRLASG